MGKIVFNEDEEILVPEPVVQKNLDVEISESDDDEAPESFTASEAKERQLAKNIAEKEAAAKKATAEKEKRRKRDQILKEQKKESKEKKKKERVIEDDEEVQEEVEETEKDENTLPEDLLAQAIAEEKEEINKRKHITAEEFDKMLEEEEKQKTKKRKVSSRRVGEYSVRVINQRPRAEKKNKALVNMKERKLHRKSVVRKDAVQNTSCGRDGAALIFRRK